MNMLLYYFLLFILAAGIFAEDRPIVKVNNGLVKGTYKTSKNGRQFASFEGIPYAKPPVGDLRFKKPEPKEKWSGTWDASLTYSCLQMDHSPYEQHEPKGTEDCLYVNVYSPKINEENSTMDVIIHIHGGAFMFGSAHYWGPEVLMDHDVVYVNFNYRLGPLGFLSTEDDVVPGNAGLKDQNLALRWINENIHHFGGNPESVTITGLSAGGASVHYHYLSPLSKDLFKQGISASGCALNNWAYVENPLKKARKLGVMVGCGQQSTEKLVECLRQRSAKQIVKAVKNFQPWLYNPYSPFGPTAEPRSVTQRGESFLPDVPYTLMKRGQINDAPWIVSVTSEEGLYPAAEFVYKDEYLPHLDENWEKLAPYILHYDDTSNKDSYKEIAEKIKQYYWNGEKISKDTYNQLVQAIGDRLFVVDEEKAARLQAKGNKSPVYFYKFSYRGDHSLSEYYSTRKDDLGVSHADDIFYVLHPSNPWFGKHLESQDDKNLSRLLVDMWLSYANTGNPKVKGVVTWPTVSKNPSDKIKYINIMSPGNVAVEEAEELGHRSFWDSLPIKENNLMGNVKDEL